MDHAMNKIEMMYCRCVVHVCVRACVRTVFVITLLGTWTVDSTLQFHLSRYTPSIIAHNIIAYNS
jgi:hypothetical protein